MAIIASLLTSTRHHTQRLSAHIIAFIAGVITSFALEPYGVWPLVFLTMPVLIWLLDRNMAEPNGLLKTKRQRIKSGFWLGWMFGFGFYVSSLYWVAHALLVDAEKFAWLIPAAVLLLPAGLALFWGAASALTTASGLRGPARILMLAISLGVMEWLRGHILTGFPWNSIAMTLTSSPGFAQIAALGGVYSLNLLAVIFAGLAAFVIEPFSPINLRWRLVSAVIVLALIVGTAGWGLQRIAQGESGAGGVTGQNVDVRIIQPNIAQVQKWDPDYRLANIERYFALSKTAMAAPKRPNRPIALIWPESALPILLDEHGEVLTRIAELLRPGDYLITGSLRRAAKDHQTMFNSVFVVDSTGHIEAVYDKRHLVPFGEYLPFESLLSRINLRHIVPLNAGFKAGIERNSLQTAGLPAFKPLICYEGIFPLEPILEKNIAKWIVNVTNDGWFGKTIGPYQHLAQVKIRAIEQGIPVVRAANTGISALIDSYGQVKKSLKLETAGYMSEQLSQNLPATLFNRVGDFTFIFLLLTVSCIMGFCARESTCG